jgi:LysR family transcriptional regulator, benzoate and cis,cis-muconate-responsive activator of ben and cat genes
MQIKALRYLKAVVEAGSFARAAARLGPNSSSLMRQISSLEDEPGLTLLERSRSGVRLTSGRAAVMIEVRRSAERRMLATLRDYLTLAPDAFSALLARMQVSRAAGAWPPALRTAASASPTGRRRASCRRRNVTALSRQPADGGGAGWVRLRLL